MQKILLVGPSCSGKTTLAKRLAAVLGTIHIELDAIHWMPNWQEPNTEEFKIQVSNAIDANHWVVDGSYNSKLGNLVWERADTVIWLNFPFRVVYLRLIKRIFTRVLHQHELWNGNKETLMMSFFDKDSLLYWIPRHWTRIRTANAAKFKHYRTSTSATKKNLLEFNSTDELEYWFTNLH